jgi:serum/glucocorticoid-regulated kinase 2
MKILKKKYIEKRKQESHVMTERNILVGMDHPFIVKLHHSFQNEKKLFFALEYCPGGELFGLLSKKQRLSEEQYLLIHLELNSIQLRSSSLSNICIIKI